MRPFANLRSLCTFARGAGPARAQETLDADIGDKALRGSIWLVGATGSAKALGFACQLALAWFLTKRDYGVYAIAISLSVFLSALRDGGLQFVLEQKRDRFDAYAGPVFWMMLTINTGTALLIAAAAVPAARFYQIPELARVILLFALTIPMTVLPCVLAVRLAVSLRFRELGIIQVVSATVRNVLMLLFAWQGFGASSLIMPLLVTSLTDTSLLLIATQYPVWRQSPRLKLWPELFAAGKWVLLGTFGIGFGNTGAYFVIGKFLPSELVGTYFFAYQVVVQLGVLLADNVSQVLTPSFARMAGDLARMRTAVPRALGVVVIAGAAASLSIAVIYAPLEHALWHGKWAAATSSVYVLSAIWPGLAGLAVLRALQMATGRFRAWGLATLASAVLSVGGTAIGAYTCGSALGAAVGFAIGAAIGAAVNACVAFPRIEIRSSEAITAILRPWLVLLAAAAASMFIAAAVTPRFEMLVGALGFAALGAGGLRLGARDDFELLAHSARRVLRGRPTVPT